MQQFFEFWNNFESRSFRSLSTTLHGPEVLVFIHHWIIKLCLGHRLSLAKDNIKTIPWCCGISGSRLNVKHWYAWYITSLKHKDNTSLYNNLQVHKILVPITQLLCFGLLVPKVIHSWAFYNCCLSLCSGWQRILFQQYITLISSFSYKCTQMFFE